MPARAPFPLYCRPGFIIPAGVLFAQQPLLHAIHVVLAFTFPVFAFKQFVSIVQLCTSAGRIVALDEAARVAQAGGKRDRKL